MTLLSGTHLATSDETKTKINTDFDILLTEEAVKKRREENRLQEVIVSIDNPGEGPPCKDPPAKGSASASIAEDSAAEGPAAKSPAGGLGNITQSFLKYKL